MAAARVTAPQTVPSVLGHLEAALRIVQAIDAEHADTANQVAATRDSEANVTD